MFIENIVPWDRQPQGFPRLRQEMLALGLVHALMPGLDTAQFVVDHAQPSAAQPVLTASRGSIQVRATPLGMAMQMHPFAVPTANDGPSDNATKDLRYPVQITPGEAFTIVWCGLVDTPGGTDNGPEGFGSLWALGADGNGNGWGARAIAYANGNLIGAYIDNSPAQFETPLAVAGGIPRELYMATACRKLAGSGTFTTFSGVGRQSATTTRGNGTMRSSTVGFDLAGSGSNPATFFSTYATGHNRCLVALVFRRALTDEQVFSLLDNPWQVWARSEAIYLPAVATAPPVDLRAIAAAVRVQAVGGSAAQAQVLGAMPAAPAVTATGAPVVQMQRFAAAPAPSAIAAAAAALVQVQVLAAQLAAVAPGAVGGAAVQAHVFGSALAPVAISAPGMARVSADALQAAIAVVGVSAGAGALSQAQVLGAAPAALQLVAAGGAARQVHTFGAAPAAPALAAAGRPLVQAQIFGATPARVAVTALPAGISAPVGEVTYSAWRVFVIQPQQRRFVIEAQRRTFTIEPR